MDNDTNNQQMIDPDELDAAMQITNENAGDSQIDFMISYGTWDEYLKYLDSQKAFYFEIVKDEIDLLKGKNPDVANSLNDLLLQGDVAVEDIAITNELRNKIGDSSTRYLEDMLHEVILMNDAKARAKRTITGYNKNLDAEYKKALADTIKNQQYMQMYIDKYGAAEAQDKFLLQEIEKMKDGLGSLRKMIDQKENMTPQYQKLANEVKTKFFPYRDLTDLAMIYHLEARIRAATDLLTDHKQ